MKRKFFITVLLIAVLSLSIMASSVAGGLFAEEGDEDLQPATLLDADKLFTSTWTNDTSFAYTADGLAITLDIFETTRKSAEIAYATADGNVRLDMEEFALTFDLKVLDAADFSSLRFVFYDYAKTNKSLSITLSRGVRETGSGTEVYLYSRIVNSEVNSEVPVEQDISGVLDVDELSLKTSTLSYSEGKFRLNDIELKLPADPKNNNFEEIYFTENGRAEGYNEARLSMSVIELCTTETEKNARIVLTIHSITNINGIQKFLQDEPVIAPILRTRLVQSASDEEFSEILGGEYDKNIHAYVINYGKNLSYEFPFYFVSFNNISLQSGDAKNIYLERSISNFGLDEEFTFDDWSNPDSWEEITNVTSNSAFTIGAEGMRYRFHFYEDRDVEEYIVFLTTVPDDYAPRFNNEALKEYVRDKMNFAGDQFRTTVYSEAGITVPNLKEASKLVESLFFFSPSESEEYLNEYGIDGEEGDKILDPDDEFISYDTTNNITVYLGYKRPDASSDWTFTSNFSLTSSTLTHGIWTLCYRVRDTATNEEVSEFTFELDVIDNSPPIITTSSDRVDAYIDKVFTVTLPTVSERGGSTAKEVKVTMYKGLRGATDDETKIVHLSKNNQYLFKEADRSTSSSVYSYYLKFECSDILGNVSTPKYVNIFVVDEPETTVDPGIEQNTLFYILLGFAGILVVFIVIMLVVPEKTEKADAPAYSVSSPEDKKKTSRPKSAEAQKDKSKAPDKKE